MAGKAVGTNEPILPVQMPRGYILGKKDIGHPVKVLSDGGNRIQCIELLNIYTTRQVLIKDTCLNGVKN